LGWFFMRTGMPLVPGKGKLVILCCGARQYRIRSEPKGCRFESCLQSHIGGLRQVALANSGDRSSIW
jgi:hypothetical protein